MKKRPKSTTPKADDLGIRCPSCHCRHCPVAYTRHQERVTTRVRDCRHCGRRFTTKERTAGTDA